MEPGKRGSTPYGTSALKILPESFKKGRQDLDIFEI